MSKNFKRVIAVILSIMLITTMIPMNLVSAAVAETQSVGLNGSGTESNPYLIGSAEDFTAFAQKVNNGEYTAHAKLVDNITLNSFVTNSDRQLDDGDYTNYAVIGN